MSKNNKKNKKKNFYNLIILLFAMIFAINILSMISTALVDCSTCHTTDPGKSAIKAKDTIVINDSTCLKCHNPNYPPTPIGYNTHLAHVGKFTAKVNFLARHPTVTNLQCSDCHKQIFDCTNCHVNEIPHIPPPLGLNCQGCHNQIDNLFRHPTINLTIHNIFHLNSTKDCQMCHNSDSMKSLRLASGDTIPIEQAYNLCKQCHSDVYKLWDNGQHYANKSVSMDILYGEDPNAKSDFENNWQNQNSCVNCHNPHNPSELYELPISTTNEPEATSLYFYAIPIVIISAIMIGFMRYNLKNQIIKKLSVLNSLKFPSLPKLSLPISITLDEDVYKENGNIKIDKEKKEIKADNDNVIDIKDITAKNVQTEKLDDLDRKLDNLIASSVPENRFKFKKYKKYKGDILFISGIVAMFVIFYAVFGTWMPMAVAISESMSPHIEKGDLIFFTSINRVDNIQTSDNGKINSYKSFENYGDVIIYKPYGQDGVTPIIHRAMYFVNKGEPMWMGGPPAPDAGYITKGDNNPDYDQKSPISNLQPVKKEWIEGIAKFRIPYIGYIRILI